MIENKRVVGVTAVKRKSEDTTIEEFLARQVVSDTGAWITYGQLLPAVINIPSWNR